MGSISMAIIFLDACIPPQLLENLGKKKEEDDNNDGDYNYHYNYYFIAHRIK